MPDRPVLEGTLVYVDKPGKNLMLHREAKPSDFMYDMWVAPGGKREPGEDWKVCAGREFGEETGYEALQLVYRGKVFFDNQDRSFNGKTVKFDFVVYCYECIEYMWKGEGEEKEQWKNKEGDLVAWVDKEKISTLPMQEGDMLIVDWLSRPGEFSKRIFYSDGKIQSENYAVP